MTVNLTSVFVVALTSVVFATDGVVTFSIQADPSIYTGTPTIDKNTPDPYGTDGKAGIWWLSTVDVTGSNKGLAFWVVRITLTDMAGVPITDAGTTPVAGTDRVATETYWVGAYKSARVAGGRIMDPGFNGGPGMHEMASIGYAFAGMLDQCGSSHLDWKGFGKSGPSWIGEDLWGVGRADRKSSLLADPAGPYWVQGGRFPIPTSLADGSYKLKVEVLKASVLKSTLNLDYPNNVPGGISYALSGASLQGGEFEFVVGSGNGCNTPQADLDGDNFVDGADYGLFAGCFNGTGNPISVGCECADLDSDNSVDGGDYGLFAGCFNGTGNPSPCN